MGIKRTRKKTYIKTKPKPKAAAWGVNWKLYQTPWWRDTAARYKQEHPICVICEVMDISSQADITDHIKPVPEGATFQLFKEYSSPENLQSLCTKHHNQKTAREVNERRQ